MNVYISRDLTHSFQLSGTREATQASRTFADDHSESDIADAAIPGMLPVPMSGFIVSDCTSSLGLGVRLQRVVL